MSVRYDETTTAGEAVRDMLLLGDATALADTRMAAARRVLLARDPSRRRLTRQDGSRVPVRSAPA